MVSFEGDERPVAISIRSKVVSDIPRLDEVIEFAENPEPRCPCVLLLDTSGTMQGAKITGLNQGLCALKEDVLYDPLTSRRLELAIITFDGSVDVVRAFRTADQFEPPT